jgi:hypothetical protein
MSESKHQPVIYIESTLLPWPLSKPEISIPGKLKSLNHPVVSIPAPPADNIITYAGPIPRDPKGYTGPFHEGALSLLVGGLNYHQHQHQQVRSGKH